jgi:hypothetical protein
MRAFSGGAALDKDERGRLRLRMWNPTGEEVYHDLSPAEADAIRETLVAAFDEAAKAAAAANAAAAKATHAPHPHSRRASGKET